MYSKSLFVLALITLIPTTAYTGVYKWTDQDGRVNYSQTRPENSIQSETLAIPGLKPGYATSDKQPEDTETKNKDEETRKAENETQKTDKEKNKLSKKEAKKACQTARNRLAKMQATGRIRQRDAQGNVTYLSDAQKQAAMKKEQQVIKNYCK